jgi:hypothetical protein
MDVRERTYAPSTIEALSMPSPSSSSSNEARRNEATAAIAAGRSAIAQAVSSNSGKYLHDAKQEGGQ